MAVSQVVLLSTGLSREDRARVQKCAKLLHGRTVTDFSDHGRALLAFCHVHIGEIQSKIVKGIVIHLFPCHFARMSN